MKDGHIFDKVVIDSIIEDKNGCRDYIDYYNQYSEKASNISIERLYRGLAIVNARLGISFVIEEALMNAVNDMAAAVANLPDKEEFEHLKRELEQTRTKAIEALRPLQELVNDAKERELRGEEMNHYG